MLAEDVKFIARSLGLAAYIKSCIKGCQTGAIGTYYRVYISGDCSIIPTRITRKMAKPRKINKNPLNVGIKSVEPVGVGEYYGFETDGNHLFLLGDFTVVHNSTQTELLVKWLEKNEYSVVTTKWTDSKMLSDTIKKAKDKRKLTPLLFSLLHAADLIARYDDGNPPSTTPKQNSSNGSLLLYELCKRPTSWYRYTSS